MVLALPEIEDEMGNWIHQNFWEKMFYCSGGIFPRPRKHCFEPNKT